ncbi:MAG: transporter substrate-binding domain-containing protein [Saprospiraceae bacterium]|nr:transporter substrate-binding domain-containing protein [Saprospiraceae bacterium]
MFEIPPFYKKVILVAPLFILLFIIVYVFVSYMSKDSNSDAQVEERVFDLEQIKMRGKLIALTDFNSTNYFVFRGQPMGYQFELLQNFAEHLGVDLEIVVSNSIEKSFKLLKEQKVDIIAVDLTVTKDRKKIVQFTVPHSITKQVLVQRLPDGWQKMSKKDLESKLIRSTIDLGGKTIYVQKNSSFVGRLKNLSNEIGKDIKIVEHPEYEMEQLVSLVASGEIDYTICDQNVAMVNKTYFHNIDIQTAVSLRQNLAWAVKIGADSLVADVNNWLTEFKKTKKYKYIYRKYFVSDKSKHLNDMEFHSIKGGKISDYDDIIKKYSEKIGWDWRLVASLIYQESRFNPETKSWAGAFGLMQLMPITAERFGVSDSAAVDDQILAGVKFLQWLDKQFKEDTAKEERIKFVLASYNVGLGHVLDAKKLAEKHGKDSNIWTNNVDSFLLWKNNPKYYRDPVVEHGYLRGKEAFDFVKEILERYEHYKNVVKE